MIVHIEYKHTHIPIYTCAELSNPIVIQKASYIATYS